MSSSIPRYLFRAWSDQSNGTNSPTLFAPALNAESPAESYDDMVFDGDQGSFKGQLILALHDKDATHNPFIFTTNSLLYAFQHAIRKEKGRKEKVQNQKQKTKALSTKEAKDGSSPESNGDKVQLGPGKNSKNKVNYNVHVICIDVLGATTPNGDKVDFRRVPQLGEDVGVRPLKARWTFEEMDYSDVFVTTNSIIPGPGSSHVSFQTLKDEGLFHLYPEMELNSLLGNPGLETPVKHFRRHVFGSARDLTDKEINLAAHLAGLFKAVEGTAAPEHLLSWFLALRNQSVKGPKFRSWLDRFSQPRELDESQHPEAEEETSEDGVYEIGQYAQLSRVVSKRAIHTFSSQSEDRKVPADFVKNRAGNYVEDRKTHNDDTHRKRKAEREERNSKRSKLAIPDQGVEVAVETERAVGETEPVQGASSQMR